ncbi:MAG: hypothetical protein ACPGJV_01510 [Bacteriovoracaceae bacterium]
MKQLKNATLLLIPGAFLAITIIGGNILAENATKTKTASVRIDSPQINRLLPSTEQSVNVKQAAQKRETNSLNKKSCL